MLSKKQLFTKGMVDISPHMLSVIPFGIICGAIVAVIVGYFSKNIIATIISGLISYWFLIFIIFN